MFDSPYPKHWHHLEYIPTRRAILSCIKLTRSLHSAEGETDHSLVYSKMKTTGKENLPHKDCVKTMPWRQQDPRWTESGGVHNYAWEISPPASLREKSKKDWITLGIQSIDQPCPTSARRKTNLQTVRGAHRDNPAIEEKRKVLTG